MINDLLNSWNLKHTLLCRSPTASVWVFYCCVHVTNKKLGPCYYILEVQITGMVDLATK